MTASRTNERLSTHETSALSPGAIQLSRSGAQRRTPIQAAQRQSLPARLLRVVRNAVIAVAIMTTVPVGLAVKNGEKIPAFTWTSTHRWVDAVSPMRTLAFPKNAAISPIDAGRAAASLMPRLGDPMFERTSLTSPLERPWRMGDRDEGMFANIRRSNSGLPEARAIVERAASGAISAKELLYLQRIAAAPLWRSFDMVARAPSVNLIGGAFVTPFAARARSWELPLPTIGASLDLANASASRAAWHLSQGRTDSAEAALRSAVSFGFVMIDNSSNLEDELIGATTIGVARAALAALFRSTGDARLAFVESVRTPGNTGSERPQSVSDWRARLVTVASDPAMPRGERFEAARQLTLSVCSTAKDMIFGEPRAVRDALARARADLGRNPDEIAYFDFATQMPVLRLGETMRGPPNAIISSASAVAGAVLHNSRFGACGAILSSGMF